MQLGKISSEDIALLISLVPLLFKEEQEARELLQQKQDKILPHDKAAPTWCHFYEQPFKHHLLQVMQIMGAEEEIKCIAASPSQIQAMWQFITQFEHDIENICEEDQAELSSISDQLFAWFESIIRTLKCLLSFGVYMNDLLIKVRGGKRGADTALFRAVKIDPTVLGCSSVVARISRAAMLDDQKFFKRLKGAINGKLTKREQKTYQDMRLVLQVLYESGAPKLSPDDLYTLFHEELNIVRNEAGDGDVKNALRQFAYQFMKQKSVSENP